MTPTTKRAAVLAATILAAAGLAACGKSNSSSNSSSAGKPVYGGTLSIVAASGPDHIDTVPAYYTGDYILERAYARQLVSYPTVPYTTTSGAAWLKTTTPAPDIATVVPTTANGGITDGGLTYTFHIRPGVDWNTTPARQVTSADFVREFKAFGNPVAPVGNPNYYSSTIAGFASYFNGEIAYFSKKGAPAPTAANISSYQNAHSISGISTPNPMTIVFHLVQPASDFLNMLAMPFASARPIEYDGYVPDSAQFRQHTISDGPYQISTYVPGKQIVLTRNPAWKQSSDPLRHQYVDKIVVNIGTTSGQTQVDDIEAGTAAFSDDTLTPASDIPSFLATKNSHFHIWPDSDAQPYMTFNLRSPNNGGAMGKLAVRQAIEYAVNKSALVKYYGGPAMAQAISSMIPPGNVGFQNFNLYPSPGSQGNAAKCKSLLASAGYPHGLTVSGVYINDSVNTGVFQSIQASLALCGVHLVGKGEPESQYFVTLGNAPSNNKAGTFDIGVTAIWFPDWFGNNGRTIMQPFYETDCNVNTINYGCFSSAQVNKLIADALKAPTAAAAGVLWGKVNLIGMQQAVYVPLVDQGYAGFNASNVHNAGSSWLIFNPVEGGPDVTQMWVTK